MSDLLKTRINVLVCIVLLCVALQAQSSGMSVAVELEGAPKGKASVILSGLSIYRLKDSERLTQRQLQQLHKKAADELSYMLKVYGFYQAKISSQLMQQNDQWQASYQIDLGQQVGLFKVQVTVQGEAETDNKFSALVSNFPLKEGGFFDHDSYESAKKKLLRLGVERGYFDAELKQHKVEIDMLSNTAVVTLFYDSGPRYKFASLDLPGTVIGHQTLSKLIPFKAGDPYLAGKVQALKNNLKNATYFRDVEVDVLTDQRQNNEVKLRVSLSEELQYKYNAGLGFGTDTGARISLGWENKYFNSSGHRLSAAARLSQKGNTVTADYQIPLLSGLVSDIGFSSEFKTEDTDSTQSSSFAIGSYYKAKRWGWGETGSIKLLSESFEVSDDSSTSVLLIPSIGWTRTWADDSIYTKQGGKISLSLSGANEALLSDVSFAQVVLRGKYIYSLNQVGRLITRASLGATEVSDFEKLPSSLRFFAGGDNSIRGFDFQSLGPLGDDGNVEGGRYLATGSVEYEHMFTDKWGAAVFTDAGNAYNSFNDPFEHSIGLGLRWRSPIGLIRFDVAKALSDSDNGIGFHLVIGPDL